MQPINKIIVGIVEDDPVFGNHFREQLAASPHVIEARLWSSAEEFSQMDLEPMPDILFIDINLPGSNGIDLASNLTLQFSEIKKIIITSLDTDEKLFQALKAGCLGYILKSEMDEVHEIINIVINGGAIITPTIAYHIMKDFQKKKLETDDDALTNKEQQTLELIGRGYTTDKVASMMDISINTVRVHVKNIYKKLNINSRTELIRKAHDYGWL